MIKMHKPLGTESPLSPEAILQDDLASIAGAELPWDKLKNKTILITGGSGFLASYLIKSLLYLDAKLSLGLRIICVGRNKEQLNIRLRAYLDFPNFLFYEHDVSSPLPSNFQRSDFVIHSASQASPKYYGADPVGTLLSNSAGTMHFLNYAKISRAEKFMFFSSGEIYGTNDAKDSLVGELDYGYIDPMQVRSCYAESKRMGETMCAAWSKQFDLNTVVVRPFHTYGPGMALDDGRVFADFVSSVVHKKDIILNSNGEALRPFCYIADATQGFLTALLMGGNSEAYNVGNPNAEISIIELARLIANLFPERMVGVKFNESKPCDSYLQSPISRSSPSIAKLKSLGWSPSTGLHDGFKRTILSFL
jgi:nucleoside-diphosphate-sugar epimerase